MRDYARKIREIGSRVSLHVQEEQLGLGHAVLSAQSALRDEPFVLLLGDHLYRSRHPKCTSCVQQLLSAHQAPGYAPRCAPGWAHQSSRARRREPPRSMQGPSVMALRRTAEAEVSLFGCATGTWDVGSGAGGASPARLNVTALVEKPTVHEARARMRTPGLGADEYLTAFGLYLITEPRSLFGTLADDAEAMADAKSTGRRLELTPALDVLRREHTMVGLLLQGERYDIGGEPGTYIATVNALASTD